MINLSILISSSEISGPGGLFDFNATLPLIAIQFLLAIFILNAILYNPLITIIEERKEYILTTLNKSAKILSEANKLTTQYEQELNDARNKNILKSTNLKKTSQEDYQNKVERYQKSIDERLNRRIQSLIVDQNNVLEVSDDIVKSTVDSILPKIIIPKNRRFFGFF
jgi:F-type H+-transporting ATPase subunit b